MKLRDKLVNGLYIGIGAVGALHSAAAYQIYENKAVADFMNGYQHDITLPFGVYFAMRLSDSSKPGMRAVFCLGLFYTAELIQKFADIGTFDLKDLLAYTTGTALAIGVERLSFTKNRTLDDIVVKPVVEPNQS